MVLSNFFLFLSFQFKVAHRFAYLFLAKPLDERLADRLGAAHA